MTIKQRIFWLAFAALVGATLLIQTIVFDAAADGKPYSVSLNSAVAFPVDI